MSNLWEILVLQTLDHISTPHMQRSYNQKWGQLFIKSLHYPIYIDCDVMSMTSLNRIQPTAGLISQEPTPEPPHRCRQVISLWFRSAAQAMQHVPVPLVPRVRLPALLDA